MPNIKIIEHDIKKLKNSMLVYNRPPKNNEGENNCVWFDTKNNKIYIKENNAWKELQQIVGGLPSIIDCGEY